MLQGQILYGLPKGNYYYGTPVRQKLNYKGDKDQWVVGIIGVSDYVRVGGDPVYILFDFDAMTGLNEHLSVKADPEVLYPEFKGDPKDQEQIEIMVVMPQR